MSTDAAGASAMDQFKFAYLQAPPITRSLTAAIVILSVGSMLIPIIPFGALPFIPDYVFTYKRIPQIWRLVTSFLVTGPKLGLILDPYFFYLYTSQMERDSPRFAGAGDMVVFFLFTGPIMMALSSYIFGGYFFLKPLTMAVVYMYANDEPDKMMNIFFVNIRAKYLPYVMLLLTCVMAHPISACNEACGLVAAHAYDFLTRIWPQYGGGRNYITTPTFLRRAFAKPSSASTARRYGTAFESRDARQTTPQAGRPAAAGSGGGGLGSWASGFSSGGTWVGRGQGRRLGGD